MTLTRFGLHFASISYPDVTSSAALFPRIRDVAVAAEQSGFDSIWVPDHVLQNQIGGGPSMPMLEAYALLGALATVTERAKLGALVTPVTFRNPALLTKAITTLDVISSGRAIFGLGAAWDADEHRTYGFDFPGIAERESRLEEAAEIFHAMTAEESPTFTGTFYSVEAAYNAPCPIQPRIPLLIGGSGERRTLPVVARHADVCNVFGRDLPAMRHKFDLVDELAAKAGRPPGAIAKTCSLLVQGDADDAAAVASSVSACLEAGAEGVILLVGNAPNPAQVRAWGEALSAL